MGTEVSGAVGVGVASAHDYGCACARLRRLVDYHEKVLKAHLDTHPEFKRLEPGTVAWLGGEPPSLALVREVTELEERLADAETTIATIADFVIARPEEETLEDTVKRVVSDALHTNMGLRRTLAKLHHLIDFQAVDEASTLLRIIDQALQGDYPTEGG